MCPVMCPVSPLFFKFYFIFKIYNIVLVLPNIEMNLPQVYMCSPSWTLLPPPSPYHPSGSSQCTSPKHPLSWTFYWVDQNISILFSPFSEVLSWSFIWNVFLCLLILPSSLCLRQVKSLSRVQLFATPWTVAYRLLHPWDFPGNSTWVRCHCLLHNPVYATAKETRMYRTVFLTLWERERVGLFGRMALKYV